jgi:predicted MFS family arabinose efflux permease
VIAESAGWQTVFLIAAGMNLLAALLALIALKPLRAKAIAG